MAKADFHEIWGRVEKNEGQVFHQKGGKAFTYTISGSTLRPSGVNRNLPRSQFELAYHLVPIDGPGEINHLQGPSYIWAILHDSRIRMGDW